MPIPTAVEAVRARLIPLVLKAGATYLYITERQESKLHHLQPATSRTRYDITAYTSSVDLIAGVECCDSLAEAERAFIAELK